MVTGPAATTLRMREQKLIASIRTAGNAGGICSVRNGKRKGRLAEFQAACQDRATGEDELPELTVRSFAQQGPGRSQAEQAEGTATESGRWVIRGGQRRRPRGVTQEDTQAQRHHRVGDPAA